MALATYSYIVSEYSTRSPPAAAHAEYQQLVPAGDFTLICNVSSAHHAEKSISTGESWMVIGWCKKLTRGWLVDQRHGPYISWCSHQKHHNLPCFGSSNPSVAPSLGKFQYNMASKQPAVIEVPDDDFPDSGPQNPVEAQSYRDQLDAIMNMSSNLLADNCRRLEVNHHITKEIDGEALVTDGQSRCGCGAQVHP